MNPLFNQLLMGIPIMRAQISFNCTQLVRSKPGSIKYIVIHDTTNTSPGADSYMHYMYFKQQNRNASADFFVDCEKIAKINDYYTYYTWHCGDNDHGYKHPECRNHNSLGVEICVNKDIQSAINNTVVLTKELMKWLNIDINHVIRHYDVTHKMCPGTIPMVDNTVWVNQNWLSFKKKLQG